MPFPGVIAVVGTVLDHTGSDIELDIQPQHKGNVVNLVGRGSTVRVALLSSPGFDPLQSETRLAWPA